MVHTYVMVVLAQTLHPISITSCTLSADQIVSQESHPLTSSVVHWFGSRCFGVVFSNQIFYYYRNFTGACGGEHMHAFLRFRCAHLETIISCTFVVFLPSSDSPVRQMLRS